MPDRPSRGAQACVTLALLGLTAASFSAGGDHVRGAAGVVLIVAASTAGCWRWPGTVAAGAAAVITVGAVAGADVSRLPAAVLLSLAVIAYTLGNRRDPVPSLMLAGVMVLGTYGSQLAFAAGNPTPPILFAVAGSWLAGSVQRSRAALATRLQETVDALAAEREAYVGLAVERERRHIAHELHDIVGHAMSLIVIQAAAGRHLAQTDPEQAAEALEAIADASRQAQEEVGRLRGALSVEADVSPGLDQLPSVVAQAAAAGLRVRVGARPATVRLSHEVDLVAFRLLQEALTNAVKHVPGADVEVTLEVEHRALRIEVHSGAARQAATPFGSGGGRGLAGMAERVHAVGGEVVAGTDGDGWRVRATLPCAPA